MTEATAVAVTSSSTTTADDAIELTEIRWEPRHEAARDLILLMLDRAGGVISNERGHVISEIRRLCNVDDSESKRATISETLALMEQSGLVERTLEGKLHYRVTLTCELSHGKIADLVAQENDLRKQLNAIRGATSEQQSVIRDCQVGFRAIYTNAGAAAKNEKGYSALNVTGVLKGCGLTRGNAKRARYYLKMLGLIASHGSCNGGRNEADDDRHLWWWEVATDRTIDVKALMALIDSDKSFEADEARQRELRSRREDGPRERMFAKGVPGVLTDDLCGPVTVRFVESPVTAAPALTPEPQPEPRTERGARPCPTPAEVRQRITPKPTEAKPDEAPDDLLLKMVAIVRQLEQDKAALEERLNNQTTAHAARIAELETKHADELKVRDSRIAELEASATQRSAAAREAAELAARYSQV